MAHGKQGTLIFANGNQYKGGFKHNKFNGKGEFLYHYGTDDNGESTK